jgi:hypothetical protein
VGYNAMYQRFVCYLLQAGFLLGLSFDPEDGGNMLLRVDRLFSTDYTALYPRR